MYMQERYGRKTFLKSKRILSVNINILSDNTVLFHSLTGSSFSFLKVHKIMVYLTIYGIRDLVLKKQYLKSCHMEERIDFPSPWLQGGRTRTKCQKL